jgi:hypothetical protein
MLGRRGFIQGVGLVLPNSVSPFAALAAQLPSAVTGPPSWLSGLLYPDAASLASPPLLDDPDDPSAAIVGARFTVVDGQGHQQTSGPQLIRALKFASTKTLVTADALAPILAFQLNMVGPPGAFTPVSVRAQGPSHTRQ